ncbi:MAG TPA: YdcF family protein [Bryobacteraceae bacterium]|jgi:uncharacterized SAM-binding protein YcdF (DUF218 family)|nr:YdcF family protein [Bryobacteraceae bacterium]
MLFFLRKLVEAMLLPIGLSVILTLAGILWRRRWMPLMAALILYAFSIPLTSDWLVRSLEDAWPVESIDAAPQADAIFVPNGGVVRGVNAAGVQWGESANRYFTGLDLALAGKAKFLVFSGAAADDPTGGTQGAIEKAAAAQHGVEADCIIVTPLVQTTEDEARAVARLGDIHSILLVTSAYQMPRAVLLFEAQGLTVHPFPTDNHVLGPRRFGLSRWVPVAAALRMSDLALREYYGLAVYRTILRRRARR